MNEITFTIDPSGQELGGGPFDVSRITAPRVIFENESGHRITVAIHAVEGTRPPPAPRATPAPGSLFGHGVVLLDVPPGRSARQISETANLGTYLLSIDEAATAGPAATVPDGRHANGGRAIAQPSPAQSTPAHPTATVPFGTRAGPNGCINVNG